MMLPVALTIAGSDSGGGAGIQADLKVFTTMGVYGTSVITALTAQNTHGVQKVSITDAQFVTAQLDSCLDDFDVKSVKTGMLGNKQNTQAVVAKLGNVKNLVVDPVMVSTSGHVLLEDDAIDCVRQTLLPLATIITPNLPEAQILAYADPRDRVGITTLDDMKRLCKQLAKLGPQSVLLKGGHLEASQILDVFYDTTEDTFSVFYHPKLDSNSTHGTGCTLSAAICAHLAKGSQLSEAVSKAITYIQAAIETATPVGSGNSNPVNHMHSIVPRAIVKPSPYRPSPLLTHLKQVCQAAWLEFTQANPFVQGLTNGTLPKSAFAHFLVQDYAYLKHYGRCFSLAAYKSNTFETMKTNIDLVTSVLAEKEPYVAYCESFGISPEQLDSGVEDVTTVAYSRYLLDVAHCGSPLAFKIATAPCFIGYCEMGQYIVDSWSASGQPPSPYQPFVDEWSSPRFKQVCHEFEEQVETLAAQSALPENELKELTKIFETVLRLEIAFFRQSYNAGSA